MSEAAPALPAPPTKPQAEWTGGDLSRGGNVVTAGSPALLDEALAIMAH